MLDFADTVAINKFERRGAKDAMRDVGRQMVRNREAFGKQPSDMPVFGTSAATFNDDGVTALYQHLRDQLAGRGAARRRGCAPPRRRAALLRHPPGRPDRPGALPRRDHRDGPWLPPADRGVRRGREPRPAVRGRPGKSRGAGEPADGVGGAAGQGPQVTAARGRRPDRAWPAVVASYSGDEQVVKVRDKERPPLTASRSRATRSPASRSPATPTTASSSASGATRTCRASSPSPPVSSRSSATARTLPDVRRRGRPVPHQPPLHAALGRRRCNGGFRPRSTWSPSTAATPTPAPTSTVLPAPRHVGQRSTT